MADREGAKTAKACVEDILTPNMLKEVWTANYHLALPLTLQDFSVGALLPAMMYLFRWGHRRGKGFFFDKFDSDRDGKATIEEVVSVLATQRPDAFSGFDGEATQAILGDLLLASCLENRGRKTGRREALIRAYPTHYMSSWIDLPPKMTNLRFVPEMLVMLLSCHRKSKPNTPTPEASRFSAPSGPKDNLLLSLLGRGVMTSEHLRDMQSDRFDERVEVGVDQLLTIRIAQVCGAAPHKMNAQGEQSSIPQQLPIAGRARTVLYDDLRVFLSAYGATVPRRSLLPMLESALSVGLTNLLMSTAGMLTEWERTGKLAVDTEQKPWPMFVDCSGSVDNDLRRLSEEATDESNRQFSRLATILMCLRIVGHRVRLDRKMNEEPLPKPQPDATAWINLIGDVVSERHKYSDRILDKLHEDCSALAEKLDAEEQAPEIVSLLRAGSATRNPAWRLAEAVTLLMGNKLQVAQHLKCMDSAMLVDEYNGLARKRRVRLRNPGLGTHKTTEVRSVVLTNTVLDFLVHRHMRKGGSSEGRHARQLSLGEFVVRLRDRYGFLVDEAPPGLSAPRELLLRNRQTLERRLRDLGVLVGVNDAESMKRLRQRFAATGDDYK